MNPTPSQQVVELANNYLTESLEIEHKYDIDYVNGTLDIVTWINVKGINNPTPLHRSTLTKKFLKSITDEQRTDNQANESDTAS